MVLQLFFDGNPEVTICHFVAEIGWLVACFQVVFVRYCEVLIEPGK